MEKDKEGAARRPGRAEPAEVGADNIIPFPKRPPGRGEEPPPPTAA